MVPKHFYNKHMIQCLDDAQNEADATNKDQSQHGDVLITVEENSLLEHVGQLDYEEDVNYTHYILSITRQGRKWTVSKQLRDFCELITQL